jgi:hypothetical protein
LRSCTVPEPIPPDLLHLEWQGNGAWKGTPNDRAITPAYRRYSIHQRREGLLIGKDAGEGYNSLRALFQCEVNGLMKSPKDNSRSVEDSDENAGKCICKLCPTFKNNKLADYVPDALFCARGKSDIPTKIRTTNCYCMGCEIFIKHGLVISHLCDKG